jgi:DNA ligase (NAD+)
MKIEIPKTCPSCNSELELVNSQLFCRNTSCSAQSSKKIEAFAKGMKIKGLGPKTIEKLPIFYPLDLYTISLEDLVDELGEKIGNKLYDEIQRSLNTDLAMFLSSCSIPLIGTTAAKKIAKNISSIEDITEDSLRNAGIGEKARYNLRNWLATTYREEGFDQIPLNLAKVEKPNIQQKGNVCITGKLNDFKNRAEAAKYLETLGYTVTTGVSQKTNFLVDEQGSPSSKRKKAEQLNIEIVTIKQLEERNNG